MGMFSEASAKSNAERLEQIILDAIHNPNWENEKDIIYDFVETHLVPLYYSECEETYGWHIIHPAIIHEFPMK